VRWAKDDLLKRAAARFDGAHPRFKWYARMKYRMDPCYRAIALHVPRGTFTVDLGTGLGMLPILLGLMGEGRRVLGVEWDAEKARAGARAAEGVDGVEIVEGDAQSFALPECDIVTIVDVLHYYDAEIQRELMARCRSALRPGGRFLIRDGDGERRGGARWTRFVEGVVTRFGWNRGPKVRFRPVRELVADLEQLGFRVRVGPAAGSLYPGNVLLVAELPNDQGYRA